MILQLLSGGFYDWSIGLGDQFKKLFACCRPLRNSLSYRESCLMTILAGDTACTQFDRFLIRLNNLIYILGSCQFLLLLLLLQSISDLFNQWQCSTLVMSHHPSGRLDQRYLLIPANSLQ